MEDYFDILMEFHVSTGHGGRDKILAQLRNQYNIPRSAVEMFIPLCFECDMKWPKPLKELIVWYTFSETINNT